MSLQNLLNVPRDTSNLNSGFHFFFNEFQTFLWIKIFFCEFEELSFDEKFYLEILTFIWRF